VNSEREQVYLRRRLAEIVVFLAKFSTPNFEFGRWETQSSDDPNVVCLPFFSLSETATSFVQAAYDLGWVLSGFDWAAWKDTPEAVSLRDDPREVAIATPDQLARLLTVCVRQDRIVEGALSSAFESGILTRILHRAAAILEDLEKRT
jgi:hypothetical protein